MLDYKNDHYCPAYDRVIDIDLCYSSLNFFSGSSVFYTEELSEIKDIDEARKICKKCPYSDLSGGLDEWDGNLD